MTPIFTDSRQSYLNYQGFRESATLTRATILISDVSIDVLVGPIGGVALVEPACDGVKDAFAVRVSRPTATGDGRS